MWPGLVDGVPGFNGVKHEDIYVYLDHIESLDYTLFYTRRKHCSAWPT